MGPILALDLATQVGWAHGAPGRAPVFGSYRLPSTGKDLGHFGCAYRDWLDALMKKFHSVRVVYESPILPAKTNQATKVKLDGLCILTEMACQCRQIRVNEAHLQLIRKHFIGVSRAPNSVLPKDRRAWVKKKTVEACEARGWSVRNDDEADALALWDYSVCIVDPVVGANSTPLGEAMA